MKISACRYLFPSTFTIDEVLEESANIGYDGLELILSESEMFKSSIHPFTTSAEEKKRIFEKANSLGLKISDVCVGEQCLVYPAFSPDKSVREKCIDVMMGAIELAEDMNSKIVMIAPAIPTGEIPYDEMWDLTKEAILRVADMAKDSEIYIALENLAMWMSFLASPMEFKMFLEDINHEYVKAAFDTANIPPVAQGMFLTGGRLPEEDWIRTLGEYIAIVHLRDTKLKQYTYGSLIDLEATSLLQGSIDWKGVVNALKQINYDGWFVIECIWHEGLQPLQMATELKNVVEKIFK